jgi:penicillin-binding protein 1C
LAGWCRPPRPLFADPLSTVIEDRTGELLSAQIAADGQWRFPAADSIAPNLAACAVAFEDRRFYRHWGVDLRALVRAFRQNWSAGRVVSGGSTLTMQVARLALGNPPRTLLHKLRELGMAVWLELRYSKSEILGFWLRHAPFGGNVVGVDAAAWRYFGKSAARLSWAEAATLAVLPNSPALIHPGRNRAALGAKRDRLLAYLHETGQLSELDLDLARAEGLPAAPRSLPRYSPHLLERIRRESGPGRYRTTLQAALQRQVETVLRRHGERLAGNQVHNLAAIVLDTETGAVLAYHGNTPGLGRQHGAAVDILPAPRSPGSLLKPMLYALALTEGSLLPGQLLPDVPTPFGRFRPQNFNEDFAGAVPADRALARSLNLPFVHLLQQYGVPRFHQALRDWQFAFLDQPADHYGLSLILGGGEASLWQLTGWYASLGRQLLHYYPYQGRYDPQDWRLPHFLPPPTPAQPAAAALRASPSHITAAAAYATVQALSQLERPDSEGRWEHFRSDRPLAWKTGTSIGFRDAWAIGVAPGYTIGVWVGNADGEGRPGLVGVQAAAPVLFEVLRLLPPGPAEWFEAPYDELRQRAICQLSGSAALPGCPAVMQWVPQTADRAPACPFHQPILVDARGQYRVDRSCAADRGIRDTTWFVLPSLQAHYYRTAHPAYRPLPEWAPGCEPRESSGTAMQLIYPRGNERILLTEDATGAAGAVVFRLAHQYPETTVYWHLDGAYLGATQTYHEMALSPPSGKHQLDLTDEAGRRLRHQFELVRVD